MKKIFKYIMFMVIGVLVSACTYDETELGGRLDDIKDRIEKLQGQITALNDQLAQLNEIAEGNPVTSVTKGTDGKVVISYLDNNNEEKTVVLAEMEYMISVPVLGVKQESETSPYYWTIGEEWLMKDGQKVPVSGFAPDVSVDAEGYWTIDGERIKDFNGNDLYAHDDQSCLFKSVDTDENGDLVITQGNGNVITVPVQKALNLTLSAGVNTPVLNTTNPVNVTYEVTGLNAADAMVAVADAQGLAATIDRETKTITVTFASTFQSGYLVVVAHDLDKHTVIRPIFFSTGSGEGGGGSDEPLDYYPIYNAQDLVAFASGVNAGTGMENMDAKLMTDIDMSGVTSWTPIGHCSFTWVDNVLTITGTPYKGHFDGQGYTLKDFDMTCRNSIEGKAYGLFGTLSEGAVVEDFKFDANCSLTMSPTASTDCGLVAGLVNASTVKNITSSATLTYDGAASAPDDVRMTLGMVGFAFATNSDVVIENLVNKGQIVSKNSGHNTKNNAAAVQVAGILGFGTNGIENSVDMTGYVKVVNCTNDGNITSDAARSAGIVGAANRFTFIDGCTNNGDQMNSHAVSKGGRLGNITCITGSGSKLRNCTNNGDLVSTTSARCGGVLGFVNHNSNTFEGCHNTGNVISDWDAGLFFGLDNVTATFTNCSVSGRTGTYNGGSYSMNNVTSSNYITSKYVGNIGANATDKVTNSTIRFVGESAVGIKSAADLEEFASLVNAGSSYAKFQDESGTVNLLDEINMSSVSSWTPIGYATVAAGDGNDKAITGNAFTGHFNGNGFKIKNLKMTASGSTAGQNYGLFGTLGSGAVVENFTIDSSCSLEVTATARIASGVVAGFVFDATVRNVTSYAPMTFNGKVASDFMSIAMIGQVYCDQVGVLVDNCTNYGNIVANNTTNTNQSGAKAYHAAGIVGFAHSQLNSSKKNTISNCDNNGNMTSALARTSGIVGAANRNTDISDCDNNGDQTNSYPTSGGARLGNITCLVANSCSVSDCINYGDLISTTKGRVGGITCLPNKATFTNCANYGEILADPHVDGDEELPYRGVFFAFNGSDNSVPNVSTWKNCTAGGKVGTYNNGSPVYDSYTDAEKYKYYGVSTAAQTYENITCLIPTISSPEGEELTGPGIATPAEFLAFLQAVNAGTSLADYTNANDEVSLKANIDLSTITNAQWQAIADGTSVTNNLYANTIAAGAFKGTFNGNNKKITGFNPTVSLASGKTFGLLPVLQGATVKNLEISGAMKLSASAVADAGMLCGTALNSTISNVKVSGTINSTGISVDEKRFSIGGICGYAVASGSSTCTIESCTSDVVATAVGGTNLTNGASAAMYGGIVGYATAPNDETSTASVVLSGCTNNGNMNVTLGRCSGIVASAMRHVSMTNCTNNGNQVNAIANGRLGNVCSVIQYWCTATNCKNYGTIEATATNYAGNVAGMFGLVGDKASINISGGGNYGTVKVSPSSTNKRYGLIGGYLNVFESISNVVVSGKLYVNGTQESINASNYMNYIGEVNASHASKITGLTYVAPTN